MNMQSVFKTAMPYIMMLYDSLGIMQCMPRSIAVWRWACLYYD